MPIEFKRKLEWTRPATRGEHVVAIQEALRDRGFDVVGRPDGIFGGNTAAAVRQFQAARGLEVTGSVDARTWIALIPPVEDGTTATDPLAELRELHAYRDGVSWRLTPRGIEVAGEVPVSRGRLVTVPAIWESYQAPIVEMSVRYDVPAELILATICTESRGNRFAVREEPGYESDEETPNKVSPGLMQTLISTARGPRARAPTMSMSRRSIGNGFSRRQTRSAPAPPTSRDKARKPTWTRRRSPAPTTRAASTTIRARRTAGGCANTRSAPANMPTAS